MIKRNLIERIANDYQIDIEDFANAVTSLEEVDFEFKTEVKTFLTEDQKDKLIKNSTAESKRESYGEGRIAEREMSQKALNETYGIFSDTETFGRHGFDFEKTPWSQFFEAFDNKVSKEYKDKILSLEKQAEGGDNELQKIIDAKIKDFNEIKNELKTQKESFDKQIEDRDFADLTIKKDTYYNKSAASIPFDVSKIEKEEDRLAYISVQKENLAQLFKNKYDVSFLENGQPVLIDKTTKEEMVDGIKEPLPINEVMLKFAKANFISLEAEDRSGRGEGSSHGKFTGARSINTMEKFYAHCKEKNIVQNSKEADTLFKEVLKSNPDIK